MKKGCPSRCFSSMAGTRASGAERSSVHGAAGRRRPRGNFASGGSHAAHREGRHAINFTIRPDFFLGKALMDSRLFRFGQGRDASRRSDFGCADAVCKKSR